MEGKPPAACENLEDIRAEIDRRDRDMVRLLGERYRYVRAAASFKTSETAVRAPERFAAVLEARRAWASEEGLDPDVVEKLFRDLVEHFIARERAEWSSGSS